jgi:flagellin-like hook-associated protein FlgL
MQIGNAVYGENYVFSGIQAFQPPYTLNENGDLCYNTVPVAQIGKDNQSNMVYGRELRGVTDPMDLTGASVVGSVPGVDFDNCLYVKATDGSYYRPDEYIYNGDDTYTAATYREGTPIPGGPYIINANTRLYAGEMESHPHGAVLPPGTDNVTAVKATDPNDIETATVLDGSGIVNPKGIANIKIGERYFAVESYEDNGDGTGTLTYTDNLGNLKSMQTDKSTKYYSLDSAVVDEYGNIVEGKAVELDNPPVFNNQFPIYLADGDEEGSPQFNYNNVPYSQRKYVDAGFGLSIDKHTGLDKNSVIKTSVSGLDAFGYGTKIVEYAKEDGVVKTYEVPNNVYEIYGEMAQALKDNDMDKFAALDMHLVERTDELVENISDLGISYKYIDSNLTRLANEAMTLEELQGSVEGIDNVTEITNLYNNKYAWELTLQFGSKYLPQSLMDYI